MARWSASNNHRARWPPPPRAQQQNKMKNKKFEVRKTEHGIIRVHPWVMSAARSAAINGPVQIRFRLAGVSYDEPAKCVGMRNTLAEALELADDLTTAYWAIVGQTKVGFCVFAVQHADAQGSPVPAPATGTAANPIKLSGVMVYGGDRCGEDIYDHTNE